MRHHIAGTLALLALAGCSAANKTQPRAGMWEWTSKTEVVEITGLPKAMADQLRADGTMPPRPGLIECISPADAAKQTVDFMKGRVDPKCRFNGLTASDGNLSGDAECGDPGDPMRGKGTIKGTTAPEEMHFTVDMTVALPQAKDARVHMRMQRDGKRIGECTAPKS